MAVKKTEDGQSFSASAYLVVPDPESPSTWKLRVEETPGKITVAQLGRAAAALGAGFRGNKVQLSSADRAAALRKLRGLYRSQKVAPGDLPSVLQQAVLVVAGDRLRDNVAKLIEAHAASLPPAMRAELTEDVKALQENLYYGIAAIQDGSLCYEAVIKAVQAACNHQPEGAPGMPMPVTDHQVIATFPATAVYVKNDGRLYQVSYRMEGTEAVLDGEPEEVTAEFQAMAEEPEAPGEYAESDVLEAALTESVALVEARPAGMLRSGRLNRAQNVIEGTTLITANSSNGVNRKRKYSDAALRQIASMAEGIPAYANHVSPELAFKPRDVRDLIGKHTNVRYDADTGRVLSDLQVLEHQAPWVFSLAERLGGVIGNSLVSKGLVRMEGDTEVVDQIVALRSGDLVSDPASTKGLFEAQGEDGQFFTVDRAVFAALAEAGPQAKVVDLLFTKAAWTPADAKAWAETHGFVALSEAVGLGEHLRMPIAHLDATRRQTIMLSPTVQAVLGFTTTTQEATDMEFNAATIATFLKDNSDQQKQVAELLGFVPKGEAAKLQEAVTAEQGKAVKLQEAVTAITAERDTLKKRVDEADAKEAIAAKRSKLQEAIAAHDLGKQFGKIEGAVSETFVGTLMEHGEADWKALLDDRLTLLKGVRPGQAPRSDGKAPEILAESGDQPSLDGLHARLAAAVSR